MTKRRTMSKDSNSCLPRLAAELIGKICSKHKGGFRDTKGSTNQACRASSNNIRENLFKSLAALQGNISRGSIAPWIPLETKRFSAQPVIQTLIEKTCAARVGVFPLTGNPTHWGHILAALHCINRLKLDTVVFLVQRRIGYKPLQRQHRVAIKHRYCMLQLAVRHFHPLLRVTDVAIRNNKIGETALIDLRKLNLKRQIEFVGLWGAESKVRVRRIFGQFNEAIAKSGLPYDRSISICFVQRASDTIEKGENELRRAVQESKSALRCEWLPFNDSRLELLSSSLYRETLDPALVPEAVHEYVKKHHLYRQS